MSSQLPSAYSALNLSGHVGIVTGGTSGLGAATAILAAQRGSKIVVAGRRSDKGNEIIKQIKANGGDAIFIRCDVSVENDVMHLVEQTVKHYGRLDWAFNNAGIFSGTHQHQPHNPAVFDEKQFEQDIAINIKGTHYCMKYELQQMVKQSEVESNPDDLKQKAKENPNDLHRSLPQYSIINNSSVAGITSTKLNYAYATTKHAIVGMSKSASQIYAKKGIRVNILCPGFVHSEMTEKTSIDFMLSATPMGRIGQADEIAETVCFLASRAASFMTGSVIPIDGGYMASNVKIP